MNGNGTIQGMDRSLYSEFLYAMENARSRLAVAMAAETKVTSRERWHRYREVEERLRRYIKDLRTNYSRSEGWQIGWVEAMSLLKEPLAASEPESRGCAQQLYGRLSAVLAIVESRKPAAGEK